MADQHVTRGLFAARLTASLMPLNSTMVAVAVPDIAREFGHSATTVTQALVASYLVTAIALQSPGGKLGDRLGQWRVFTIGQVTIGVGAVLGLVAPNLALLSLSRMLMAAGGALVVPATIALMRLELPAEQRGRAFGTFGAIMGLAAALGPIIGGVLVDAFSWEAVFLVNVPVLVTSAAVAATVAKPRVVVATTRFDTLGSVLLTLCLALLVVGAEGEVPAWGLWLAAGAVATIPFAWSQRRAHDPVVDFTLFRSVPFAAGTLLIALQNLVMYALIFELPLVLDHLFALGARETGELLIFLMVAMVATSLVAGRLADRLGSRPLAVGGSLLCCAGLAVLAAAGPDAPGDVRLPLALLGMGLGLGSPAAQSASLSAVSAAQSGMAAGVSSTMRYLGGVAGIAILGRTLDLHGTDAQVLGEHRTMLAVFAVALAGSVVCAALLPGRTAQQRGRDSNPR